MSRASLRLVALALALGLGIQPVVAAAIPPGPPVRTYDWCSNVVFLPDERRRENGPPCTPVFSPEEVAAGAGYVLVGSYDDVVDAKGVEHERSCGGTDSHRENARYVARLRELRVRVPGPPLRVIHEHRFDLVSDAQAAERGFRADFLLSTDRPFSEVKAFFAKDGSPACRDGGCRLTLAYGAHEDRGGGNWLSDWIDRAGGKGRHESVVYYLARPAYVDRLFWTTAALADLRNPAYRAWRVALAKRALEIGGYDAIDLNHKFSQFADGAEMWIGGKLARDAEALRALSDQTLWTAPPRGYGYPEYVAGWAALAKDLRAAGVPYSVALPTWPWPVRFADDPSTPADEGALIREAARGAKYVRLDRWWRDDVRGLDAFAAELEKSGAEVVWLDTRCGLARR
jgi:hypothetical protein